MKTSTWIWLAVLVVLVGGGLLYRQLAQEVDSRGATRLMRALEEKNTDKTRQLLENGTDVNARDKSGQTALFYAARYAEDPLMLHKLVAAGADVLATDKHGYTPLMTAAEYNASARVVMALARYGRFSAEQTANKNRALAVAARHNHADIIKTLLAANASPVPGPKGQPPAELLASNEKLSEQEKTDLRQVMLVLEILDAREKFKQENRPQQPSAKRPVPAKELAKVMPEPAPTAGAETGAKAILPEVPLPQEKQMDLAASAADKQSE